MKQEYLDIIGAENENNIKNVDWYYIAEHRKLSEDFIREFQNQINWVNISRYQILSKDFIREFKDKVDWYYISKSQILSEDFIKEFKNRVNWDIICKCQELSENFIRECKDEVNWIYISKYQKLSEDFIREFKDKVDWFYISQYQKLSEDFIREFHNKVNKEYISKYQTLSEDFIREFKSIIYWSYISYYQRLSPEFMKEFNLYIPKNNWLYKDSKYKMQRIKDCGLYEIDGDYIIAYKSTRRNGLSAYNNQYTYQVGKTYHSHCDCNIDAKNSFGLSAWTKKQALNYFSDGELYKVKIHIDDIGALVQNENKLRCFKLKIIEKLDIKCC